MLPDFFENVFKVLVILKVFQVTFLTVYQKYIFLFFTFTDADVSFKIGFLDRVFIASFSVKKIPFNGRKIFSIQLVKKAFKKKL